MGIRVPIEFGVKWRGRYLRPSAHAIKEMDDLDMNLHGVERILEMGKDPGTKRAKGTVERIIMREKKIIRVVVVESYAHDIDEWVWLVKHIGGR